MTDQNERHQEADELLLREFESIPSWKFENVGDEHTGIVIDKAKVPQREPGVSAQKHYRNSGKPAWQLAITLQTDERDPSNPDDDGRRRTFVREFGQARDVLSEAIAASGEPGLTIGGRLTRKFLGTGTAYHEKENRWGFTFTGPADVAVTSPAEPKTDVAQALAGLLPKGAATPELLEALRQAGVK